MQKHEIHMISVNPSGVKPLVDHPPASSGQDVLGQFKANLLQVSLLQKRLNFMVREINSLVKVKKA